MTNVEAIRRIKEFGLHHAIADLPHSARTVEAFDLAIEALQHFKKGTFEYDEEAGDYVCSECGHYTESEFDMEDEPFEFNGMRGLALKTPHYCKHCGAYMRGEENDE